MQDHQADDIAESFPWLYRRHLTRAASTELFCGGSPSTCWQLPLQKLFLDAGGEKRADRHRPGVDQVICRDLFCADVDSRKTTTLERCGDNANLHIAPLRDVASHLEAPRAAREMLFHAVLGLR